MLTIDILVIILIKKKTTLRYKNCIGKLNFALIQYSGLYK